MLTFILFWERSLEILFFQWQFCLEFHQCQLTESLQYIRHHTPEKVRSSGINNITTTMSRITDMQPYFFKSFVCVHLFNKDPQKHKPFVLLTGTKEELSEMLYKIKARLVQCTDLHSITDAGDTCLFKVKVVQRKQIICIYSAAGAYCVETEQPEFKNVLKDYAAGTGAFKEENKGKEVIIID